MNDCYYDCDEGIGHEPHCIRCDKDAPVVHDTIGAVLCLQCWAEYHNQDSLQGDFQERLNLLSQIEMLTTEKERLEEIGEQISTENASLKYELETARQEGLQLKQFLVEANHDRDAWRDLATIKSQPSPSRFIVMPRVQREIDIGGTLDIMRAHEHDSGSVEGVPSQEEHEETEGRSPQEINPAGTSQITFSEGVVTTENLSGSDATSSENSGNKRDEPS